MTHPTRLLVTGERRSGTTLLANLLNAADQITVYRDFMHIARLPRVIGAASLVAPLTGSQKQALIRHLQREAVTLRAEGMADVTPTAFDTLIDFYTGVLDQITRPGDLVVGHKTTAAHGAIGPLLQHVPRLKVVYLLRDPRDVTLSAVKRFPHQSWSVHVGNWRDSYGTVHRLLTGGDTRALIHVVRFDHLLMNRAATLSALARFLGIDEIREPQAMTDYGREWQDNSSFGDLRGGLDTAPVDRWRQQDPALGRTVELLLHDLMAQAGFELSAPVDEKERRAAERKYRLDRLIQQPRSLIHRARRKLTGGAA